MNYEILKMLACLYECKSIYQTVINILIILSQGESVIPNLYKIHQLYKIKVFVTDENGGKIESGSCFIVFLIKAPSESSPLWDLFLQGSIPAWLF